MNHERLLRIGGPIVVLVFLIAGWEAYIALFKVPLIVLPTPRQIATAFYNGFASGLYQTHFGLTAREVTMGYLLGVLVGFGLGTPIALSRTVEIIFYPYILALQTMPKVALAPLMMIWVGFGIESKIIITAIVALFPVMVNVIVGLRTIDEERINLIRAMKGGMLSEFLFVRLPSAAPYVFAGLKTAVVLSLLGAITAEFVGAEGGLGYLMSQLMYKLDTPGVFAVLLLLSVLGVGLFLIADWLHRVVVFWDRPDRFAGRPSGG